MKTTKIAALLLAPTLLLQGCVTYSTRTRTWGNAYAEDERYGQYYQYYRYGYYGEPKGDAATAPTA